MALDENVLRTLQQELESVDSRGTRGPRLSDDARRLLLRIDRLIARRAVAADMDREAIVLACHAVQLPLRDVSPALMRTGIVNLKDRCEQAAELLVVALAGAVDDALLDRTARLLHETPQRNPVLDEAKLLADAINLDDFGFTGLLRQAIHIGLLGQGIDQVVDVLEKRQQYGYLEARLKEGFHFEISRSVARQRHAAIVGMLSAISAEHRADLAHDATP